MLNNLAKPLSPTVLYLLSAPSTPESVIDKAVEAAMTANPDATQEQIAEAVGLTKQRVKEAPELKEHRRPTKEEIAESVNSTQPSRAAANGVHRDTQRKLDRLAKDRPDLLARVKSGELKVNRAAIDAGISKRHFNRLGHDLDKEATPILLNHGGNHAEQVGDNQVASKGGMTKPYILARLERDGQSELAAQVKSTRNLQVNLQVLKRTTDKPARTN